MAVTEAPFAMLDILGQSSVLPKTRVPLTAILEAEQDHVQVQLGNLTVGFRDRVLQQLGIESVAAFTDDTSANAAFNAATRALSDAGVTAAQVAYVLDFSTYASDRCDIWSLAHAVQFRVAASDALAFGVHGSGCAGLHAALQVASALLQSRPRDQVALLVAADRAPDGGRSCLPISVMADAASALVVGMADPNRDVKGRVRSVVIQHDGRFSDLLVAESHPARMRIDGQAFESRLLPLHYVMLHRVLVRSLRNAGVEREALGAVIYPNTSALDRSGVVRALGIDAAVLVGPGPANLGHAFANDMLINAGAWFEASPKPEGRQSAWLAAGSGFTWASAVIEHGSKHAIG